MTVSPAMTLVGLNIGGTTCSAVVARSQGDALEIIDGAFFATATVPEPTACLDGLCELATEQLERHRLQAAVAGISCGGPLDSRSGTILAPPNLPGWNRVAAAEHVAQRLGIPAHLENDANAGAVAEWRWGAGGAAGRWRF
jgi:glucokinase